MVDGLFERTVAAIVDSETSRPDRAPVSTDPRQQQRRRRELRATAEARAARSASQEVEAGVEVVAGGTRVSAPKLGLFLLDPQVAAVRCWYAARSRRGQEPAGLPGPFVGIPLGYEALDRALAIGGVIVSLQQDPFFIVRDVKAAMSFLAGGDRAAAQDRIDAFVRCGQLPWFLARGASYIPLPI